MSTHKLHPYVACPLLPPAEPSRLTLPPGQLPQLPTDACRETECAWFCLQGDPKTGQVMVNKATGRPIGSCAMVVAASQLAQLSGIIGAIGNVRAVPVTEVPPESKPS